ncbi:tetratricopeptide repeat protein [Maridesulfovibrio zosterae]|uniref:tetratricopeptide repeat protein n=1 Tax=Maridesulfovibrio zosterae TaxID=82171 RepID=UPI0003F60843|nr:tetratricopeptide repeat protein [Maridesulfovibrio zosterae]
MAKKKKTVGKKNVNKVGTSKQSIIVAVVIALAVGLYLGGVFIPALKDTAAPQDTSGSSASLTDQIESTKQMTEAQPDSASLWAKLGNLYYDTDQYGKAIEAYERSLKIKSDDAHVLTDLGVMYRRNGNPRKAVENFDKAIIAAPDHETARFNKGIVLYYDIKDKAAALRAWKGLVDMNPSARTPSGGLVKDMIQELSR